MDKKFIIKSAVKFLNEYSNLLGTNGCNDFDLSTLLPSFGDRVEFIRSCHKWNGDLDQWRDEGCSLHLPDFAIIKFIAYLLEG